MFTAPTRRPLSEFGTWAGNSSPRWLGAGPLPLHSVTSLCFGVPSVEPSKGILLYAEPPTCTTSQST